MPENRQIGLPLDLTGRGERPFLLSPANAAAVRHLEHWGTWPVRTSILTGPRHSGRSTLAAGFAARSGGRVIEVAELESGPAFDPARRDAILFHAWNAAQDGGKPLLLVAERPPVEWGAALPDLLSRLAAAPVVTISEPDDALALALIERGLADAGTAFSMDLPSFLLPRIERSYAAIHAVLERLNRLSLSSSRKISIPVAKEALSASGLLLI